MLTHLSTPDLISIFAVVVKSLFLFAATGGTLLALRKSSASNRALTWQMCLCGLLMLPILSASLPALKVDLLYTAKPIETIHPVVGAQAPSSPPPTGQFKHTFTVATHDEPVRAQSPTLVQPTALGPAEPMVAPHPEVVRLFVNLILWIIWTPGAILLIARLVLSSTLLRKLDRASADAPDSIVEISQELAAVCGVRRSVRLIITRELDSSASPMTWGWQRPVILLPAEAADWRPDRLRPVLLHEMGHIARLDWPVLILADIAAAIYWFHPLVWFMRRRLRIECEQACDDSVLAHGQEPAAYASLLLDIARTNICGKLELISAATLAIAMAPKSNSGSILEQRVRSIMQIGRFRQPVTSAAIACSLLLMALLTSPLSAARIGRASPHQYSYKIGAIERDSSDKLFSSSLSEGQTYQQLSTTNSMQQVSAAVRTANSSASGAAALRSAPPSTDSAAVNAADKPMENNRVDLRDIQWGPIHDGLQAGIQIAGNNHKFTAGQRLGYSCYIRNASSSDIAFSFGNHWYMEQIPEVWDESNPASPRKMNVVSVFLTGEDPAFTAILKPRETVSFYSPGLGLGEKQDIMPGEQKTGIEKYPYLDEVTNGRPYVLRQTVLYHLMTRAEVKRLAAKSRSKSAVVIEPRTLQIIGSDGYERDEQSTVIPIEAESKPLTTAEDHFTIIESFAYSAISHPASPAGKVIAWGKPAFGLQAGLRSPNNQRLFRIGDTVEMEYIVRNVSKTPITFEHDVVPGVAGVISDITDAHGKPAYTLGLPVLHTSELVKVTLQPGEMIVIGKTRMGLVPPRGSLGDLKGNSNASNWVEAPPGKYQIRHLYTLALQGEHAGSLTLYTGNLPLDIDPRNVDISFENPGANVSWGRSKDGLRAGLALTDGKATQVLGKEIHTDLYMNNVSQHDITIWYIANDDKFFVPDLWDARGVLVKPDWRNMTVEQKIEGKCTLKPGQSECIAHPFFTIAIRKYNEQTQDNVISSGATWFVGSTGKYRMRMTAALNGHTSVTSTRILDDLNDPQEGQAAKTMWSYFPTGEVTFDIAAR